LSTLKIRLNTVQLSTVERVHKIQSGLHRSAMDGSKYDCYVSAKERQNGEVN